MLPTPRRAALLLLAGLALVLLIGRATPPPRPSVTLGAMGRGPTVVLVHGLGVRAEHWLPVARDLARDHRVVLVELPGHGLDAMPGDLTIDGAAALLDRAIAREGDEPVLLVGHSVGGLVAAAEAVRSPRRVRALVLVETALRPQLRGRDRDALLAGLERDYRGTLRENYLAFGRDSAQGAAIFAEVAALDSLAIKRWLRIALATDLSGEMATLQMPLLAVLSARSWPDTESWRACADTLGYASARDVTPVRVERVGHFIMLDRPGLLADLIRRFDRGHAPPALAALAR
jgi:pimeloyl-ACP methyl ester carboxylesterase